MIKAYMGIDPGAKGGIAIITSESAEAHRYPSDISNSADLYRELAAKYDIVLACIEKVHSMPGQGVRSMFSFGMNYGAHLSALSCLSIPYITVTPRSWQKELLDPGTGETKARSLNMARRLYPDIDMQYKADDGKADALHLARWAKIKSI